MDCPAIHVSFLKIKEKEAAFEHSSPVAGSSSFLLFWWYVSGWNTRGGRIKVCNSCFMLKRFGSERVIFVQYKYSQSNMKEHRLSDLKLTPIQSVAILVTCGTVRMERAATLPNGLNIYIVFL